MPLRSALTGLVAVAVLALPAGASALPDCTTNPAKARPLASGQGTLESSIVDRRGRLYFTSGQTGGTGQLLRMNRRKSTPKPVVTGVEAPGGLALLRGSDVLLGHGNSILGGTTGTLDPQAGLLQVSPNGDSAPYADGLAMANGIARARDGTVFASDDVGIGIDRVAPDGSVENVWADIISSNGLVVSRDGQYLYAAQTFQPAAVQRITIADPTQVEPFFQATGADIMGGPDGMTGDRHDNLFVAVNLFGEVWRLGQDGSACVVTRGLSMPSAVARGRGDRGFKRGNLYVVEFGGKVTELRGAVATRP